MTRQPSKKRTSELQAAIALCGITVSASVGLAARLYIPNPLGNIIFVITRICLLAMPIAWFLWIDRGQVQWQRWSRRDLYAGGIIGLIMGGIIIGAYASLGQQWIDPTSVQNAAVSVGLGSLPAYLAFATYFTLINAFVEEYIWRWFVYQKWTVLVSPFLAIWLSAGCFTLHHVIALEGYVGNLWITVFGSIGVFLAGAVWSWCRLRYQSLWGCYISHAIADLAIALVGWHLLF
jgi:membrane protease YdiL (CAAX protease family)